MLEGKESIIWVEWLQDSEDFIKGGVYAAEAAIRNRDTGLYSRYQVRDERGDEQKCIQIEWISSRSVNFRKGKTYTAVAASRQIRGGRYSRFQVTDEDGDSYTLLETDLGKKYRII